MADDHRFRSAAVLLLKVNQFRPNSAITREEAAVFIARALRLAKAELSEGADAALEGFADHDQISTYAEGSIRALVEAELLQGDNGSLKPKGSLTRAEAAVLLYRIYNLPTTHQ